jgi:murein L,D-transpeptidase YafK
VTEEPGAHIRFLSARLAWLLLLLTSLCAAACRSPEPPLVKAPDRIVIVKSAHVMFLMRGSQVLKTYKVALGRGSRGAKERSGDHRTPEGEYLVDSKRDRSRFYRALHISYPNAVDIQRAKNLGVDPGGAIEIHGLPPVLAWLGRLHLVVDWTDGCIAVTNPDMAEIWTLVAVGTPVEIRH